MDEVAVSTDMPRERMLHHGAQALADYELLAILLRTGSKGSNVLEFSRELLRVRGGLVGLFNSRAADLQAVRGLGKAKTADLTYWRKSKDKKQTAATTVVQSSTQTKAGKMRLARRL